MAHAARRRAAIVHTAACALSAIACNGWSLPDDADLAEPEVPPGGYDSDEAPMFESVVRVQTDEWIGSGVAISDRLVITAAHVALSFVNGCSVYGETPDPSSPWTIRVIVGNHRSAGGSDSGDVDPSQIYRVDAVAGIPMHMMPANAYSCCGGVAFGCAACDATQGMNYNAAFDIALLHLDRPLDVTPMRFVARVTDDDADPDEATYAIRPEAWPKHQTALIAGVGFDPDTGELGRRKWGTVKVHSLGWDQQLLLEDACEQLNTPNPATAAFHCGSCMIRSVPSGPDAIQGHPGDSGGPFIVNHPLVPSSRVAGLPSDVPFMVAINAGEFNGIDYHPVTWDARLRGDDDSGVGSFLLRHIRDWDGDGVLDDQDDCPLLAGVDGGGCP